MGKLLEGWLVGLAVWVVLIKRVMEEAVAKNFGTTGMEGVFHLEETDMAGWTLLLIRWSRSYGS
jgi:hypothetical protein